MRTTAEHYKRRTKTWRHVLAHLVACSVLSITLFWLVLPKPPLLENVSFSRQIFDCHGRLLRVTLSADEKYRLFTPLAEISPALIDATLWQEDRHFRQHPGVNPVAALRSAWHFLRQGGRARAGASTVSMQLARLRFGLRTRTLRGKLAQTIRAVQLERHYSKAQLLEAYLNLAPYGRNIEGVGAASRLYFDKMPRALSRPEAIALSVIPQSPARRVPHVGRENPALTAACARFCERRAKDGEPVDALSREFRAQANHGAPPFLAPHFTTALLRSTVEPEVRTTLDLDLQRLVERQIGNHLMANTALGLRNAAALLVDTRTMDVLAQVGSANFSDPDILGQSDGTRRPRSPGSALKPFVYALALDAGLIHPLSLLADTPRRFGDYEPENFDRDFAGPLSATDALARSRNVPAVALAARLRQPTFYTFLQRAEVRLPREESFYGLTLPLGGAEVTMEDLARLYAMLANGGRLQPLRKVGASLRDAPAVDAAGAQTVRVPDHSTQGRLGETLLPVGAQLLSPEAAFLTLEMLGRTPSPGLSAETDPAFPIFWKTGTSHGFRDAWSAAVFDGFVLVIWIGEFDGRSNPAFVGRTAAGPLLFSIINALRAAGVARPDPHAHEPSAAVAAHLRRVELCAVSGGLPTAACHGRVSGWFIPGVSPIAPCEIHREVLVDAATGLRVGADADDGVRALRREVFEFWPADLLALFRQAGVSRRVPPPFLPGSGSAAAPTQISGSGRLRITSPRDETVYALRANANAGAAGRELMLRAQTEPGARKIYWFADKTFLGVAEPRGGLSWHPSPGRYRVTALDDQGRSDVCSVTLQSAP